MNVYWVEFDLVVPTDTVRYEAWVLAETSTKGIAIVEEAYGEISVNELRKVNNAHLLGMLW